MRDRRGNGGEKRDPERREERGREHITRGRLCHGVNGVLPLPIIPVPFEPWPLHTERSLTPSSASSRGLVSDMSARAGCQPPCFHLNMHYITLCNNALELAAQITNWGHNTEEHCSL